MPPVFLQMKLLIMTTLNGLAGFKMSLSSWEGKTAGRLREVKGVEGGFDQNTLCVYEILKQ